MKGYWLAKIVGTVLALYVGGTVLNKFRHAMNG